jgi:hypothetical protein
MKRWTRRLAPIGYVIALSVCATLAVVGWSVLADTRAAESAAPALALRQAWQRARETGSYHFGGDLDQTTLPAATVANVGLSSRQSSIHMEGDADLPAGALRFTLWSEGTLLDERSGTQFRVEDGNSYARQGDQPWQEIDDISGSFAPGSDVLGFLSAAVNVREANESTTPDASRSTLPASRSTWTARRSPAMSVTG